MNEGFNNQCGECPAVKWCGAKIDAFQGKIDQNDSLVEFVEMGAIDADGSLIIALDDYAKGEIDTEALEAWELLASVVGQKYVEKTTESAEKNVAFWKERIEQTEADREKMLVACRGARQAVANMQQRMGVYSCGSASRLAKHTVEEAKARLLFGKPI